MVTLLEIVELAIQKSEGGVTKLKELLATLRDVAPDLLVAEDTTAGTIVRLNAMEQKVPLLIMIAEYDNDGVIEEISLRETGVENTWRVLHRRIPRTARHDCLECKNRQKVPYTILADAVRQFASTRHHVIQ